MDVLRLRRPDLPVDDRWGLVRRFFSQDVSSGRPGSYDSYIESGTSPTNRIVAEDVIIINTFMSARSPHSDWAELIARGDVPELAAISPSWDLYLTSDEEWERERVSDRLTDVFAAVRGNRIGVSRATKVLHIKRPALIPVCDSYVLGLMGIPDAGGKGAVALIEHLRLLRTDLMPTLLDLQERLRGAGYDRSLVRITDALIWGSYPDTWLQRSAD